MRTWFNSVFQSKKPVQQQHVVDNEIQDRIRQACQALNVHKPVEKQTKCEAEPTCVTVSHTKFVDWDLNDYNDGAYREVDDWRKNVEFNREIAQTRNNIPVGVTISTSYVDAFDIIVTSHFTVGPKYH